MKRFSPISLLLLLTAVLFFSCQKEEISTDPNYKLEFGADTIAFDTVFTTIGSTTKRFTVTNSNASAVELSSVFIAGDYKSPFRLNVNGASGKRVDNIIIPAKDSIYVFVEITVDPTGENLPMVVHDSIVFSWNGNNEDVNLIAYGQDVHLLNGEVLKTQRWINDKPYLIYNSVFVDAGETLRIDPGCQLHFHKKSSLFVQGTLNVDGTMEEPVYFQGDRLEEEYKDVPGQWGADTIFENGDIYFYGGIHFLQGSIDNTINYSIIKNANKGIQVDSLGESANPVLTLTNTRIENMTLNCLNARTTFMKASNCIFANAGFTAVSLLFGGDYEFVHCTMANYYEIAVRQAPALLLNNYYEYEKIAYAFDFKALFTNCIVYGDLNSELAANYVSAASSNPYFKSCLIWSDNSSDKLPSEIFKDCLFNVDPLFINENNLALDSLSPARNVADLNISKRFPLDLMSNSRLNDEGPDIGALEYISNSEVK